MGYLNKDEEWEHVTPAQRKIYLALFRQYNIETGARWRRYVDSEHVKGIAEHGYGNYFLFRSIFRSVAQFAFIGQISAVHWWYGSIYEYNPLADDFTLLADSSTLNDTEFRRAYRACGGSSNF